MPAALASAREAGADVATFARLVRNAAPHSAREAASTVDAVARESGVRARRVQLRRHDWWRTDLGPLIVRRGGEVVGLVPSLGGYTLLMSDGRTRPVDALLAREIDTDAWTLHEPLPATASPDALADAPVPQHRGARWLIGALALTTFITVLAAMASLAGVREDAGTTKAWVPLSLMTVLLVSLRAAAAAIALREHGLACRHAGPRLWDRVFRLRSSWLRAQDPAELAGALRRADSLTRGSADTTRALVAAAMLAGALVATWFQAGASAAGLAALGVALVVGIAAVDSGIDEIEARIGDLAARSEARVTDALEALATLRTVGLLDALYARDADECLEHQRLAHQRGVRRAARELIVWSGTTAAAVIAIGLSPTDGVLVPLVCAALVSFAALDLAGALRGWRVARRARAKLASLFTAPIEPPIGTGRRVAAANALQIGGLAYTRPGAARPLLVSVDLEVTAGEVVAIQGASGIGKSTLLRLMLGLETADAGVVSWSGVPLDALDPVALRARVGVVLQDQRPPSASLRAILAGPSALDEQSAWHLACEVGLAGELATLPMGLETLVGIGTLSPAAQQRLLVGRALANAPDFLILDETLSALDPGAQRDLVAALRRRGVSCLLLGHSEELVACADRAYTLVDGRLRLQPATRRATSHAPTEDRASAPSRPLAAPPLAAPPLAAPPLAAPPLAAPPVRFREAARNRLMTPLRNDDPAPVLTWALLGATVRCVLDGAYRARNHTIRTDRTMATTYAKADT